MTARIFRHRILANFACEGVAAIADFPLTAENDAFAAVLTRRRLAANSLATRTRSLRTTQTAAFARSGVNRGHAVVEAKSLATIRFASRTDKVQRA